MRYQEVQRTILSWIDKGILKPGDRIPSIRQMCTQTGFSAVTVQHAYAQLENDGVLQSRSRSGFFVSEERRRLAEFPPLLGSDLTPRERDSISLHQRLYRVMSLWQKQGIEAFGHFTLSPDLFPSRDLGILLQRTLRWESHGQRRPVPFEGHPLLRKIVAKRVAQKGANVSASDVIVTQSAQHALDLSLRTVTKPGGTILIESPTHLSFVAALERHSLRAIEIYSHPNTGVDPDQFDYLLARNNISACLIMSNHHYPTGVTYSQETLRRIVKTASTRMVPIIESDIYGELSHDPLASSSLKSFDVSDIVLQIGSFTDTLGPRHGLGWIINGTHQESLLEKRFFDDPMGDDAAVQNAVATYMQQHSYERHLRRLRENLSTRVRKGLSLISQQFPLNCSVSRPSGGFMC